MGLSKHENTAGTLEKELERLDISPVMLDGLLTKPSGCFRLSGNPPQVLYNTNCPDDLKEKVEAILLKYRSKATNVSYFYMVEFDFQEKHYTGRLTPEFKKSADEPSSWHVVLNEVFFGYLHKDNNRWEVTEQRPTELVEKVGNLIDNKAYEPHTV